VSGAGIAQPPHYHVLIRRNSDGAGRLHRVDWDWFEGPQGTYRQRDRKPDNDHRWWARGNMSCDCARAQHFAEAAGEPDPDIGCSRGLYAVPYAVLPDGRRIGIDGKDYEGPYIIDETEGGEGVAGDLLPEPDARDEGAVGGAVPQAPVALLAPPDAARAPPDEAGQV
jgi:hypothetical protein